MAPEQVHELNVGPVESRSFEVRREAIGIIDFNQDNAVQVFSPYQGRIGQLLVRAGDDVAKGQVLFTVQIPDLAAAASTLISAAGTLKTANETLQRAKSLYETQSIPLKELQQNSSDQQAADAAYRAAHKTLALFGLTEAEIGEVEKTRQVDTEMPVRSPFAGRVTARSGAPGQLVQPGANTATVTVANIQQLWMVANVPESEVAAYRLGQAVSVKVQAYPDQAFSGKVNYIADAADPNTHRVVVRAEVADRQHQLKPQMLATFTIQVGAPQKSPAVPANALARESDGSTSAWVTEDELRFVRRRVQTGLTQDGMVQITQGLTAGEKVARDKALFLSNLYLITSN
ncbi:MAG: efflux RND transporter periplasmic adaptor subunit [Curvibacter sp.]|nr:efflux RND transporter periplasmic adaptor subunit [Curvibacter sp.]